MKAFEKCCCYLFCLSAIIVTSLALDYVHLFDLSSNFCKLFSIDRFSENVIDEDFASRNSFQTEYGAVLDRFHSSDLHVWTVAMVCNMQFYLARFVHNDSTSPLIRR